LYKSPYTVKLGLKLLKNYPLSTCLVDDLEGTTVHCCKMCESLVCVATIPPLVSYNTSLFEQAFLDTLIQIGNKTGFLRDSHIYK